MNHTISTSAKKDIRRLCTICFEPDEHDGCELPTFRYILLEDIRKVSVRNTEVLGTWLEVSLKAETVCKKLENKW